METIQEIEHAINKRLKELNISARRASLMAEERVDLIRDIRRGRMPQYNRLVKLFKVLGLSLDGLYKYDQEHPPTPKGFELEHSLVPRLDVRAAGGGAVIESEAVKSHLAFRREWLHSHGLDAHRLAIIEVTGDSMEPLLKSGEVVLVDTRHITPKEGAIVVVQCLEAGLLIKRSQQVDKTWLLVSENSAYKPVKLLAQHRVIGHVVNWRAGKFQSAKKI